MAKLAALHKANVESASQPKAVAFESGLDKERKSEMEICFSSHQLNLHKSFVMRSAEGGVEPPWYYVPRDFETSTTIRKPLINTENLRPSQTLSWAELVGVGYSESLADTVLGTADDSEEAVVVIVRLAGPEFARSFPAMSYLNDNSGITKYFRTV